MSAVLQDRTGGFCMFYSIYYSSNIRHITADHFPKYTYFDFDKTEQIIRQTAGGQKEGKLDVAKIYNKINFHQSFYYFISI